MLISVSSKASGVVLICLVSVTEKGKKKKKVWPKVKYKQVWNPVLMVKVLPFPDIKWYMFLINRIGMPFLDLTIRYYWLWLFMAISEEKIDLSIYMCKENLVVVSQSVILLYSVVKEQDCTTPFFLNI